MTEDASRADATTDTGRDTDDADAPRDTASDAPTDTGDDGDSDSGNDAGDADNGDAEHSDTGADATDVANDTADTTPAATGETCQTAIDVSAGGTWADQSTVGASDDYDSAVGAPGCPSGAASGPDLVYVATPAAATEYKITVEPAASFDPFIYVRASCSDQACMAGTVFNGAGESETVTFELQANETGHIIVDGELGDSGDYTLTVEIL